MGSLCQKCLKKEPQQPEKQPKKVSRPQQSPKVVQTERRLTQICNIKQEKSESICNRSSQLDMSSVNTSRQGRSFMKIRSTALFSQGQERRNSGITQMTFDSQSILFNNVDRLMNQKEYYTLIDKLAFIKKTKDEIKITSPDGQSVVNCSPPLIFSTLNVAQGRPIEVIQEIPTNKYIQRADSPIQLKIHLKCKKCSKHLKATFCKGIIDIKAITCSKCGSKDQWKLLDIESSAPVWGQGCKIQNHEEMQDAPGIVKVMGCVHCYMFANCKPMQCGCLLCSGCQSSVPDLSYDQSCHICQGDNMLY